MDRPFLVGNKVYLRPLEPEDITDEYIHWINDSSVVLGRIDVRFPLTRQAQREYVDQLVMSLSRDEYLQLYPEPILDNR